MLVSAEDFIFLLAKLLPLSDETKALLMETKERLRFQIAEEDLFTSSFFVNDDTMSFAIHAIARRAPSVPTDHKELTPESPTAACC